MIEFTPGYAVTTEGDVYSLNYRNKRGVIHKLKTYDNKGYRLVSLTDSKGKRKRTVHRIVAETFIPNHDNLPQVNHIDGNKANNNVSNLEWVTPSQNLKHHFKLKAVQ